jgi:hypothetical protein
MLTKVQKEFTFQTALHFEDKYMINYYEMLAIMEIMTEEPLDQNIAIERMTYFLNSTIENVIFIPSEKVEAIEKYQLAGIKVCEVPEEPYDQIIGYLLTNKCNAIMEGKIIVSEIIFGSKLSNLIKFHINGEIAGMEYPNKQWYNDKNNTVSLSKNKNKIVKLFDQHDSWKDLGLIWQQK